MKNIYVEKYIITINLSYTLREIIQIVSITGPILHILLFFKYKYK